MGDFAKYGWIITKDNIGDIVNTARGTVGPSNINPEIEAQLNKGVGLKFRMKDDDGEVYYEGRLIEYPNADVEASFAPLDDFGAPNAGCTSIEYAHPDKPGVWVPL